MTKVELESVDGNPLAGKTNIKADAQGNAVTEEIKSASTIIAFNASDPSGFTPGKDYYISPYPATFTAVTGSPFSKTDLWQIISVSIRL